MQFSVYIWENRPSLSYTTFLSHFNTPSPSTRPRKNQEYETFPDMDELISVNSPMSQVVQAMQRPDSGLEIRDRMWLKITIPNAFIGTDMIDWLLTHVEGFQERRDARKYASHLLKAGFIRHTVNKITFSEQVSRICNN